MLTLGVLWEAMTGKEAGAYAALPLAHRVITDAVIDSRRAIPGCLFLALPGERVDGHQFLEDAFARGAAVALVEKDVPGRMVLDLRGGALTESDVPKTGPRQPMQLCLRVENVLTAMQTVAKVWRTRLPQLRVIGITGSVGKSTSKELIASVLAERYPTLANEASFNNEIGLPLTILKTSEAHRRLVLEMGFYIPGDIAFLCDIAKPQVGVITLVAPVHLERAGSMEAIERGKGELVEALPPDGCAILNADDERVQAMASRTSARVFTYGLRDDADLRASHIEGLGLEGVRFQLHYRNEVLHVRMPLLGQHSVHTALRAAAVGLVEGLTWEEILNGLSAPSTQLRLVAVNGPGHSLIIDDTYNASPDSVIAALNLLLELDGRKVAVLGEMLELGDFAERGHRMVGARAAAVADFLVTIGEKARWIAEEAHQQGMSSAQIATFNETEPAQEFLSQRVQQGDVVLVKGSHGLHMDRIVLALEVPE
jgi:UDP-N-acetylmuramoyl-tripeptide--D-alanyl-D-alanine ligase